MRRIQWIPGNETPRRRKKVWLKRLEITHFQVLPEKGYISIPGVYIKRQFLFFSE
jgi:hypothetical protein